MLIAIGSGGLTGLGFAESRQKHGYLVGFTAFTDTIFSVYAEEFGFIGSVFLVIIFLIFILRGFHIANHAPDKLGSLLAAGITIWFGLQIFFNIGANVVLLPLTGIPLPFISYGGSAMIVTMAAMGILLNISRQISK
jgi:cell division protein FtsW